MNNDRVNIKRLRQEMRWETYKALAAIIMAVAAVSGLILSLAHWTHI